MVNGLMVASSHRHWNHLLPFQKPNRVSCLIGRPITTLMQSTWILYLATAFWLSAFNMHSSWWIMQRVIIGCLVYNPSVVGALHLLRAAAGALSQCFYSDCNAKLFDTAISENLMDNDSKVIATPAKHQSANSLVEPHWKTMVHMARAYLTEKQMPCSYMFVAITHAARMMNAIPVKFRDHLASPFLLVHGVGHDERTWIPLFLAVLLSS
jgi:hypothetical protein